MSVCLLFFIQVAAFSDDWSQFRGTNFGITSKAQLPVRWTADNVVWKTAMPGPGASCPVTFGDRIYMTCYSGYGVDRKNPGEPDQLKRHLLCINSKDGSVIWQKTVDAKSARNVYNQWAVALHGYASSTPAVDESGVYVFFGATGLIAFDHNGQQRWTADCGDGVNRFGSGNSPLLHNHLVIINASPESGDLIAFDKSNGDEAWRQSGIRRSWNTPAIYKNATGATELAVSIERKILAYNPDNGQQLWSCAGIDDYICPSIVVKDGIVFASGARKSKMVAVRSGGSGDVSASHKLWELDKGSNVSSPVIHDGHIYWAKEQKGIVYCANIESGKLVYEQRLEPASGLIYASPLLADGNVYYVSRKKGTYVVAAKPKFELVAHNMIEGDASIFNANPVPSGNGLLLRSDKFLYRIGNAQ